MSVDTKFNLFKANAATCDASFLHKTLISLAMIFSISALSVARAQDQTIARDVGAMTANSEEQEFFIDSDQAVSEMLLEMPVDPSGDVDRDFVAMMVPHAQGAIDVARAELKYGHSEYLRRLAQSIIGERESEISGMRSGIGNPSREE
jgi:uncharacterized protein (DUF305 family)